MSTVHVANQLRRRAQFALTLALVALALAAELSPGVEAAEARLERPVSRATAFVPRIGKRIGEAAGLRRAFCASYGFECAPEVEPELEQRARQMWSIMGAVARGLYAADAGAGPETDGLGEELMAGLHKRQAAGLLSTPEQVALAELPLQIAARASASGKQIAFTPRIGR